MGFQNWISRLKTQKDDTNSWAKTLTAVPRKNNPFAALDLMTGVNCMASQVILEISQTHYWKNLIKKKNFAFSLQKYLPPQKVTQPGTNSYSFGGNCFCCRLQSTWWASIISRQAYCLLMLEFLALTWCWFLLLVGGILLTLPMRHGPEMHHLQAWIHPVLIACNRWSVMSCACLLVTPLHAHCLQSPPPP